MSGYVIDKTILIVEDMTSVRDFLKAILKELGFNKIYEAKDGVEASDILNKYKISIIISDWNMPRMDGLELLNKVRENEQTKDIPFLMLTTESEKDKVIEAIKSSVNAYIVKPFTPITVTEKLKPFIK